METITIKDDIRAMYIPASSFPAGVLAAHQQLHQMMPFSTERKYFGISRPEQGTIQYKAVAAEMYEGEAEEKGLPVIVLKSGKYISTVVHSYMQDVQSIGRAFNEMLDHPGLDPHGYCIEWYINDKDVQCMIRLEN